MKAFRTFCATSALIASPVLLAGPAPLTDSGLVSLLSGQIAQLNVANLDPTEGSSCMVNLSFIDSDGTPLVTQDNKTILAGTSASTNDFPPFQLIAGASVTLRAHIDYHPQLSAGLPMASCNNLLPTLEVIDNSGTRVILSDFVSIPSAYDSSKKTPFCHKGKTIEISWSAVPGHMRNHDGDHVGACK